MFDSRFCNVAMGNEKGHGENLVKRAERTFLTPLPDVLDLSALTATPNHVQSRKFGAVYDLFLAVARGRRRIAE